MEWTEIVFLVVLPLVATLYASVGHGGASGYLALMGIWGISTTVMKPSALVLNLFVSSISFIAFARKTHFRWKLFLPFALTSIPMAFLGGMTDVDPDLYKRILGVFLVFAVARMVWKAKEGEKSREVSWIIGLLVGAGLGYLSGLIGIGGGIILSPIILLLGWGNVRETAAVSALFIFVNSASGLTGQLTANIEVHPQLWWWVGLALGGGLLGGWLGSTKLNLVTLRYTLAAVLALASIKLLFQL